MPFFIFAGLIMERGGISLRLVRFVETVVGHLRGGLLQVSVVSMYIVSGLSGSKPADVAAVGTVMRDRLRDRHGAGEGAAVLAASAIMGETVPPSIAMLIVGSITQLSMAGLFIGGIIPAAVMAVCLMVLIYVRARRAGTPCAPRAPVRSMLRAGLIAVPALLMPVILLVGILAGIATPTEVATFAVLYGLGLAIVVYRVMSWQTFLRTVLDTASLTGMLLFIFAASAGFSWSLTVAYVPQRLVALLHGMQNSTSIFMVASILLLVGAGVLLEGLPSLNVLAPLLLPIAAKIGVSELHYALVLIIAMGVGGFMPLAGVGFYVCCAIMQTGVEEASRAMVPYLIVIFAGLLIVAFVPWFTLFLPHYFGFGNKARRSAKPYWNRHGRAGICFSVAGREIPAGPGSVTAALADQEAWASEATWSRRTVCSLITKETHMNRRTFLKNSMGVAGLALAAPYVTRAAAAPLTLRFAHYGAEDHPSNIAAKQFASRVESRTGGAIKIRIFPNNQLGDPPAQAQQIKLGTIDMGLPTQGQLQNYEKAFATVMLPFIFDSPAHVFRVSGRPGHAVAGPARREARLHYACGTGSTASAT